MYCINRLKNKKIRVISLDVEKVFFKTHQPFMIKVPERTGIQAIYFKIIRDIDNKPTANFNLNGKKHKKLCPLSPCLDNTVLEIFSSAMRKQK